MTRPRVFVTRAIPEAGLAKLQAATSTEVWEHEDPPPYEVLLSKLSDLDGLLSMLTDRVDSDLIESAGESLKVISQMAVGVDNIDVQAATQQGIPVGHTPGVLTETTADFAFALMMAAARRIAEGATYVKAGQWTTWIPTLFMGRDIHDATLGIVGFGRIGRAVARRAHGFGMRVLFANRSEVTDTMGAERRELRELLRESDFVSLHVPLTRETTNLIGEPELRAMKPSAILVNASRGAVVDPDALFTALHEGEIAHAALDVTEPEPIPADHPLLTLDNCLIVPHIASSSVATRNKMAAMAAENLLAGLEGKRLPHCANPEVYDAAGLEGS